MRKILSEKNDNLESQGLNFSFLQHKSFFAKSDLNRKRQWTEKLINFNIWGCHKFKMRPYLNSLEKYIIQNKAIRTNMKNTSKSLM